MSDGDMTHRSGYQRHEYAVEVTDYRYGDRFVYISQWTSKQHAQHMSTNVLSDLSPRIVTRTVSYSDWTEA